MPKTSRDNKDNNTFFMQSWMLPIIYILAFDIWGKWSNLVSLEQALNGILSGLVLNFCSFATITVSKLFVKDELEEISGQNTFIE